MILGSDSKGKVIANKILTREELQRQVANGAARAIPSPWPTACFDLLHVGHVRYLHAAKQLGGRLGRGDQFR